jgi:hypothetical protein
MDSQGTPSAASLVSPAKPVWGLILLLAAVKLAIHLPLVNRYGYFRDELYFLDCGRHLDWGYVDHAPLIGLVSYVALLLGGSLPLLRTISALAGAGLVILGMLIAARLGGKRFAQMLTGVSVLVACGILGGNSLFTMNAFEPLFWMGCAYVLIAIIQTGDSRLWLAFGLLAGVGLQNKHSMLFFGAAMAVGILVTPERRELGCRWIWVAAAVALLVFLPNAVWQWQHGFPTLEDLRNVKATGKNVVLSPLAFIGRQILTMHPATLPIWLAGLWFFLFGRGRRYRALGVTYAMLLLIFIVLAGKDYYLFPAYAMLFAGGAVAIEGWLDRRAWTRGRLWPKLALTVHLVLPGVVTAPIALPLLSPERYQAYERALGLEPPKTEVHHDGPLPQMFGDQFGWEELVADVARIYHALPPEERAKATIFASNYGEAGALHLYGPKYGLPDAICAHQTHFFWGPQGRSGDLVIFLQWGRQHLEKMFDSVEQAGEHFHPWGMAEENRPIFLCRGLRQPLAAMWPRLKHWN